CRLRRLARDGNDLHREAAGHAADDVAEGLRAGVVDLAGGDETCVVGAEPGHHGDVEAGIPEVALLDRDVDERVAPERPERGRVLDAVDLLARGGRARAGSDGSGDDGSDDDGAEGCGSAARAHLDDPFPVRETTGYARIRNSSSLFRTRQGDVARGTNPEDRPRIPLLHTRVHGAPGEPHT